MHIVIKDGFLYQPGHITPYCSIQWPRSFRHIAVNSTCRHYCSTAYQLFCSNPPRPDCSICMFYSTLKWRYYIHEVFYLLARAQMWHLLSALLLFVFVKEKCHFPGRQSCFHLRWVKTPRLWFKGCFSPAKMQELAFKCRSKWGYRGTQRAQKAQCYCGCYATV